MNNQTAKGIRLVFATAIISGFAIFINKFGIVGFDPYLYTFLKNALVAGFLVALLLGIKEFSFLKKLKKKDDNNRFDWWSNSVSPFLQRPFDDRCS
jgi:hypothetical protein